jgi:hypothetical protein
MQSATDTVSALFQPLGDPETLRARAAEGLVAPSRPCVNAHIHLPPNFSAFDTVAQAIGLAEAQHVGVLGVSNYYDYTVYSDFARQAAQHGIFPLFGIEIIALIGDLVQAGVKLNDPGNPGKMYLCGKGITSFDPMTPAAAELLSVIRSKDSERMARMTGRLAEVFAAGGLETRLDADAVKAQIVARHGSPVDTVYLQERHLAQAFQEALFAQVAVTGRAAVLERIFGAPSKADPEDAAAVQNEIRSHLMKAGKSAYIEETFVGFEHAYKLILALGGIPCYPTLADGTTPLCPYEAPVETLIANTKARNIHCAEFIPVRNSPEVLTEYVRAMRAAGLVVTAGTEHNTRDMLPIAPTCIDGRPIPDEIQEIFWEGACVVAAHQYLVAQGQPGFVDTGGHPNSAYASDEARIAAFRSLGAAVIQRYQETLKA